MDFKAVAGQVEQVLEQVMQVEPMIAGMVGVFVPGVGMIQPEVLALAPMVETALKAVAAGNNGDMISAVAEVAKHLLPGLPNSSVLSPPASMPTAAAPAGSASTAGSA